MVRIVNGEIVRDEDAPRTTQPFPPLRHSAPQVPPQQQPQPQPQQPGQNTIRMFGRNVEMLHLGLAAALLWFLGGPQGLVVGLVIAYFGTTERGNQWGEQNLGGEAPAQQQQQQQRQQPQNQGPQSSVSAFFSSFFTPPSGPPPQQQQQPQQQTQSRSVGGFATLGSLSGSGAGSGNVQVLSDGQLTRVLQQAGSKLVVVDFTATWCGPCKRIAPVYAQLSTQYTNVVFTKVDVDECPETARTYGVRSMPTFMFFKNNSKIHEFSGASEPNLRSALDRYR